MCASDSALCSRAHESLCRSISDWGCGVPGAGACDLPRAAVHVSTHHPRVSERSVDCRKLHAMIELDVRNSRLKDFYDVWFMANTWTFQLDSLRSAIALSFQRRGSVLPNEIPFSLTDEFLTDFQKMLQWKAFVGRLGPGDKAPSLAEVGAVLRTFLLPCFSSQPETAVREWTPNVGWHESGR